MTHPIAFKKFSSLAKAYEIHLLLSSGIFNISVSGMKSYSLLQRGLYGMLPISYCTVIVAYCILP